MLNCRCPGDAFSVEVIAVAQHTSLVVDELGKVAAIIIVHHGLSSATSHHADDQVQRGSAAIFPLLGLAVLVGD